MGPVSRAPVATPARIPRAPARCNIWCNSCRHGEPLAGARPGVARAAFEIGGRGQTRSDGAGGALSRSLQNGHERVRFPQAVRAPWAIRPGHAANWYSWWRPPKTGTAITPSLLLG